MSAIQTVEERRGGRSWLAGRQEEKNGGVKQGGDDRGGGLRLNGPDGVLRVRQGETSLQVADDAPQPRFI